MARLYPKYLCRRCSYAAIYNPVIIMPQWRVEDLRMTEGNVIAQEFSISSIPNPSERHIFQKGCSQNRLMHFHHIGMDRGEPKGALD